jgi:hypothetical protein
MATIKVDMNLVKEAENWIDGALECKTWNWSHDQWEAAAMCREKLRAVLNPAVTIIKQVSKAQKVVLLAYEYPSDWCPTMAQIAENTGLEKVDVRRSIRALARKGLLKWHRGLLSEVACEVGGSGYQLTAAGFELAREFRGEVL